MLDCVKVNAKLNYITYKSYIKKKKFQISEETREIFSFQGIREIIGNNNVTKMVTNISKEWKYSFLKCIEQSSSQFSKNQSHSKKRGEGGKGIIARKISFFKISILRSSSTRLDFELSSRLAPEITGGERKNVDGRKGTARGWRTHSRTERRMHL